MFSILLAFCSDLGNLNNDSLQLLSLSNIILVSGIDIKEIQVENGLDDSCTSGNQVVIAFFVITPNPVKYVQCSVGAQCDDIQAGKHAHIFGIVEHEQLRNY